MTSEDILWLVHHPGTTLPSVHLCNTANGSDTKLIGHPKNFIGQWDAASFATTSISFK